MTTIQQKTYDTEYTTNYSHLDTNTYSAICGPYGLVPSPQTFSLGITRPIYHLTIVIKIIIQHPKICALFLDNKQRTFNALNLMCGLQLYSFIS